MLGNSRRSGDGPGGSQRHLPVVEFEPTAPASVASTERADALLAQGKPATMPQPSLLSGTGGLNG